MEGSCGRGVSENAARQWTNNRGFTRYLSCLNVLSTVYSQGRQTCERSLSSKYDISGVFVETTRDDLKKKKKKCGSGTITHHYVFECFIISYSLVELEKMKPF